MSAPWRYRNKMEFSFGEDDGRLVLGLHRRGSWRDIVEIADCRLASARANGARQAVADACRALGLRAYDRSARRHEEPSGLLRHLVVREARTSGDLALNLYVATRFAEEEELVGARARRLRRSRPSPSPSTSRAPTPPSATARSMLVGPPFLRETPRRRAPARAR